MYFHCLAYAESIDNTANSDMNAAADAVYGVRNNHLIITDPMNLIAAYPIGAQLTRARFGNAFYTQLTQTHLWPIEQSATVPDDPAVLDFRDGPMPIPINEEVTIEVTNAVAGPTATSAMLLLANDQWSQNWPAYQRRVLTRATTTIVAASETTWSAEANLTFERDLLNGVYAVVGCNVVAANALFFRLRFPDQLAVNAKQNRPGGPVQDTLALAPWKPLMGGLGEWGRFHTFNPPQVQVFADAAGGTYEVRLDLLYLGESRDLLFRR